MNRAFEKELSRALAAEPDTAAPKTLLRRCRAEHVVKQRSGWRDLLHCQFKLLGWKVWALEAMAALALYSVGRELALWEKAWTLRNALFGLSTLAMLTALLGLPFLYRASQYKMLELEHATYAGIGRPLVMRFLLLLAGETILLGVLVLNVRAAVPWSIGQLLAVLTVPFLTANNELLLLLRWVRPEWMMTGAVHCLQGRCVCCGSCNYRNCRKVCRWRRVYWCSAWCCSASGLPPGQNILQKLERNKSWN